MVREQDFAEIRRELISVRRSYEQLEQLIENADDLGVDVEQSEQIEQRHEAFINDLLTHYMRLEDLLTRAGAIEDDNGQQVRQLPAAVPDFVTERENGRANIPDLPDAARNVARARGQGRAQGASNNESEAIVDRGSAERPTRADPSHRGQNASDTDTETEDSASAETEAEPTESNPGPEPKPDEWVGQAEPEPEADETNTVELADDVDVDRTEDTDPDPDSEPTNENDPEPEPDDGGAI